MFLKKITILSTLFFLLGASNVFAIEGGPTDLNNTFKDVQYGDTPVQPGYVTNNGASSNTVTQGDVTPGYNEASNAGQPSSVEDTIKMENGASNTSKSSAPQFSCEGGKDALCSEQFKIDTGKFSPGGKGLNKTSSKATINGFMTTLIKKLMVALGSLALIVMVIGAGFMMFAMGKDDNLNKGKTIFKAGIIALVIALSSYFMVSFLSYILYS